jgi:hypothetical protein
MWIGLRYPIFFFAVVCVVVVVFGVVVPWWCGAAFFLCSQGFGCECDDSSDRMLHFVTKLEISYLCTYQPIARRYLLLCMIPYSCKYLHKDFYIIIHKIVLLNIIYSRE